MTNKIRIYQLAKELNIDYKEIITDALELGIEVKSHSSSVSKEEAELIKESLKELEKIPIEEPEEKTKDEKKELKEKVEEPEPEEKIKDEKKELKEKVEEPAEPEKIDKKIKPSAGIVVINPIMTTLDLAEKIGIEIDKLIQEYFKFNFVVTENQRINTENTKKVLDNLNYDVRITELCKESVKIERKDFKLRAPVVTVMGHVDHGKTLLLDTIRHTNVISKEEGGITQHIGAARVKLKEGEIVFIDTPGHEAFTAMRARGAQITDIVVLVVAGDAGVMPQTIEAINHARAAGVPIIVAINKMDLPNFDSKKIKTQLSDQGLVTEDWGGDIIAVEISAKKNKNISELLEMINIQAEMMELNAPVDGPAIGVVIESELDKRVGSTATIIVTEGILKLGDSFVCGIVPGKIKALSDDTGNRIKSAGPSIPVKILGFEDLPQTSDILEVVTDRTVAREISQKRKQQVRKEERSQLKKVTLEDLQKQLLGEESKQINIILKTDVSGSLEAIKDALSKINTLEVALNVIHSGVGAVTKKDIMLGAASQALIIGFNISASNSIKDEADREGLQIRTYRIIYEIIDDIEKALEGLLEPEKKEVTLGRAEVKKVFNVSKTGTVAGCGVINGIIRRTASVRILRDSKIVYEGKLASLKRFKNNINEVADGYECGMNIENFNDIKVGDIIESFIVEKRKRTLSEVQ